MIGKIFLAIFDFIGYFISCGILFALPAYLAKRFKVVGAFVLVLFSFSVGYVVINWNQTGWLFWANKVVLLVGAFCIYDDFDNVNSIKRHYANSKVANRVSGYYAFFTYLALMVLTYVFFNIEDYGVRLANELWVAIVFIFISSRFAKNFWKTINEMVDFIVDNKCVSTDQIADRFANRLLFKSKNGTKYKMELFELLELSAIRYNDYKFRTTRRDTEQGLCIDGDLYFKLKEYFEDLLETKKIVTVNEVAEYIYSETKKPVVSSAINYFVDFENCGFWYFDNVIIEANYVKEIGEVLKTSLKQGNFSLDKFQSKYGISVAGLKKLANFCGCELKIV